jgi:hypothetical protein
MSTASVAANILDVSAEVALGRLLRDWCACATTFNVLQLTLSIQTKVRVVDAQGSK